MFCLMLKQNISVLYQLVRGCKTLVHLNSIALKVQSIALEVHTIALKVHSIAIKVHSVAL